MDLDNREKQNTIMLELLQYKSTHRSCVQSETGNICSYIKPKTKAGLMFLLLLTGSSRL